MKKGRKVSGGKYIQRRKKKLYESGKQKKETKLGKEKRKTKKVAGGNKKSYLLASKFVNLITKEGKSKKVEIKKVLETPSNHFLARQNIITKGTIIQTEVGKARITSRPTQEGVVNGVLIE
ncbi:30S ribosomal protein S8e [Candidatus Pacearchaeota archaeon]|nr:30S ribosomal protein S8e [Candidatus Pacearchaeota archaeon]